MIKKTLPPRSKVPINETWNLDSIFPDVESWEQAKEDVLAMVPNLSNFQGKLGEGPKTLGDFYYQYETALRKASLVMVYGMLDSAVDTANQPAQARAGQGQSIFIRLNAATAFVNPELMTVGFETLRTWIKQDQRLMHLEHFIDELEHEQAHVRSNDVEEILALSGEPLNHFYGAYNLITNADLQFDDAEDSGGNKLEVGQSSIKSLISHRDRKVRQTAYKNYARGYLDFQNTIASLQLGAIHRDIFRARARHYPSALEASLSPNKIPPEVFHSLVNTFRKNLPTWHRYWRIRKRVMGYQDLHVYDIKAPLMDESPEIRFEKAIDLISEGLAPLGEEYIQILRKGALEERWVDRAKNRGKRQGAFSSGVYDSNPFILISYADDIFSLSTLAHEFGHSMHSYFTRKNQPFLYSHYSLFVAEVASNFNQAMVREHLFNTQTDIAFQVALIEESMSNFHRYFFIMPTLARWELEVHERAEKGQPLTADIMSDICADFFEEGYGDEVTYDRDQIGITWAQFSHMYMNFYVYQYATGISAAHALAKGVQEGGQKAVERYLDFLKAGASVYPLEALQIAGVDMTSSEPVDTAFKVLEDYVDRLETIVDAGVL